MKGMKWLMGETWNGLGMDHLNRLECSDGEFSLEVAWNLGCRQGVDVSGPGDLWLSSVASIYALELWFTEGHIETAGYESLAALGFRKKVFLYAKTARGGSWPIQSVRPAGLVRRGPQVKLWESIVGCILEKGKLIVQPSLWAHAVLTLEGPSVDAGCDGAKVGNRKVMDSLNRYYGFGLGRDEMKLALEWSQRRQGKVVKKLGECGGFVKAGIEQWRRKKTKTRGRKKFGSVCQMLRKISRRRPH